MFEFFKKNKLAALPGGYTGIVNQEEYNDILNLCKNHLINDGETILRTDEGEIVLKDGDDEKRYFLDNLVRVLAQDERENWPDIITTHFNRIKDVPFALDYIFKDFGYAAQFLQVLIKPDDFQQADSFLKRPDFPGTYTFLVIDFNERFTFLTSDDVKEWGQTIDDLFEIALSNVSSQEIEIQQLLLEDTFPVYAFFDGDFSASYIIDLERNARFAIGSHGSVVAIPTKGSAFIHPIETKDVMELIGVLAETISPFYHEDPGCITMNFYWSHDNIFELFPSVPAEDGYMTVNLPTALMERLEQI